MLFKWAMSHSALVTIAPRLHPLSMYLDALSSPASRLLVFSQDVALSYEDQTARLGSVLADAEDTAAVVSTPTCSLSRLKWFVMGMTPWW